MKSLQRGIVHDWWIGFLVYIVLSKAQNHKVYLGDLQVAYTVKEIRYFPLNLWTAFMDDLILLVYSRKRVNQRTCSNIGRCLAKSSSKVVAGKMDEAFPTLHF